MGTLEDLVCGGDDNFAMTDESHFPVLYQITAGLNQLHSLRIVHGNLKPSNILISFPKGDTGEPVIKLADFGIRHAVRDKATGLTQFRLVTTEGWMCPTDQQDPFQPSFDVFSLGCLFVFAASNGIHPFGTDPISRIANRQPMTLILGRIASSLLTPDFLDLISRMLNFEADQRPSSSDVLGDEIFNQLPPLICSSAPQNGKEQDVITESLSRSPIIAHHRDDRYIMFIVQPILTVIHLNCILFSVHGLLTGNQ